MSTRIRLVAGLVLGCISGTALAQDDAAAMPSVEVKAVRSRMVAYAPWYERARQVRDVSDGRVALGLRLSSVKPGVDLRNLQMALEAGDATLPVKVDNRGFFLVPLDAGIAAHDGAFAINRKAGTLSATAVLVPTLPRDQWTFDALRLLLKDARAAARRITPWYLKAAVALVSPVHSVSVCSSKDGAQLKVVGDAATVAVPLTEIARDDAAPGMLCHHFSGDEGYEGRSRLVLPEDAVVLLL